MGHMASPWGCQGAICSVSRLFPGCSIIPFSRLYTIQLAVCFCAPDRMTPRDLPLTSKWRLAPIPPAFHRDLWTSFRPSKRSSWHDHGVLFSSSADLGAEQQLPYIVDDLISSSQGSLKSVFDGCDSTTTLGRKSSVPEHLYLDGIDMVVTRTTAVHQVDLSQETS